MRTHSTNIFPLVLLGLLAALTFWLERAVLVDDGRRSGKNRHDPDFVVDKFTVRRFNTEGALQHVMTAQKMLHYADDDTTDVVAPQLTYFGKDQLTRLTAQTAWVSKDGKEVTLNGDVRMVRAATPDHPELSLVTSKLRVFPDDEQARTDAVVTITQEKSVITGTGLEADNRTHVVKLLGRVKGFFIHNKN